MVIAIVSLFYNSNYQSFSRATEHAVICFQSNDEYSKVKLPLALCAQTIHSQHEGREQQSFAAKRDGIFFALRAQREHSRGSKQKECKNIVSKRLYSKETKIRAARRMKTV